MTNQDVKFIGDLTYKKKISQVITLNVEAAHLPYLLSRANMEQPLMYLHYNFNIAYKDRHHWEGNLYADMNHFYADSNNVITAGGWVYSCPLKLSAFTFKAGYALSYATAKRNQFVPVQKGNDVVSEWMSNGKLNGYYDRYFTPKQQTIHSLLASLTIKAGNKNEIGCKANIGFSAQTQNPYLILSDANGNTSSAYYTKSFNPYDLDFYWLANLSKSVALKAEYKYLATNFYTSHYAGISLTINFLHARHS